jgi:hypothetical protein
MSNQSKQITPTDRDGSMLQKVEGSNYTCWRADVEVIPAPMEWRFGDVDLGSWTMPEPNTAAIPLAVSRNWPRPGFTVL